MRDDLETLIDRMWPLEDQLGNLQAYHDFAFLLEHVTDSVDGHVASRGVRVQPIKHWEGAAGPCVQPTRRRHNVC